MIVNKTVTTVFVTLCIGAIGSAAKAVVDVEVLKAKIEIYAQNTIEIKADVKELRNDVKTLLERGQ